MYKHDLALNNPQWLICHKSQSYQTENHRLRYFFQGREILFFTPDEVGINCLKQQWKVARKVWIISVHSIFMFPLFHIFKMRASNFSIFLIFFHVFFLDWNNNYFYDAARFVFHIFGEYQMCFSHLDVLVSLDLEYLMWSIWNELF